MALHTKQKYAHLLTLIKVRVYELETLEKTSGWALSVINPSLDSSRTSHCSVQTFHDDDRIKEVGYL